MYAVEHCKRCQFWIRHGKINPCLGRHTCRFAPQEATCTEYTTSRDRKVRCAKLCVGYYCGQHGGKDRDPQPTP